MGLAIRKGENKWRKFALTNRVIPGLDLDVKAGSYRYKGPIFEIVEGHRVFKSELEDPRTSGRLRRAEAEINLRFESRPIKRCTCPFPSSPVSGFSRKKSRKRSGIGCPIFKPWVSTSRPTVFEF